MSEVLHHDLTEIVIGCAFEVYNTLGSGFLEKLNEVSRKGKMGRIQGTMELLILGTKYIAVYRETEEEYRILRVLHSSQFHGFNVLSLKV